MGDLGVARRREHLVGKLDALSTVPLAVQPRFAADQLVQSLLDDRQVRPGDGIVEPHYDVSGADAIAVVDAELADDAAGQVLDLLDVRIDHDGSDGDHGSGKLRGRCPSADTARKQRDDGDAGEEVASNRAARSRGIILHRSILRHPELPSRTAAAGPAPGHPPWRRPYPCGPQLSLLTVAHPYGLATT